jgi:bifunctional N-acetylglucosamine-1-phosphate-uridyltransferase/glucosamine-1-phosphate-acetyltransferase GlmU-like protein
VELPVGAVIVTARAWHADASATRDKPHNDYQLTDIVAIAGGLRVKVNAWTAAAPAEFAGINSREELAQMEAQLR